MKALQGTRIMVRAHFSSISQGSTRCIFWQPKGASPVFSNYDKVNYHHAKTEDQNCGDDPKMEIFEESQRIVFPRRLRHNDVGDGSDKREVAGHRGCECQEYPALLQRAKQCSRWSTDGNEGKAAGGNKDIGKNKNGENDYVHSKDPIKTIHASLALQ